MNWFTIYENPETSEVSEEFGTLTEALSWPPKPGAEIIKDGRIFAIVENGNWSLNQLGGHQLEIEKSQSAVEKISSRISAEYDKTLDQALVSKIRQAFYVLNGDYSDKTDFVQKVQNILGKDGISWDQGMILSGDKGMERIKIGYINVDNPFSDVNPIINAILAVEWEKNENNSFTMTARLLTKPIQVPKNKKQFSPGPYTFNPDLYEKE